MEEKDVKLMDLNNLVKVQEEYIELLKEYIELIINQVMDLSIMSKIELGNDVLDKIKDLKTKTSKLKEKLK